MPRAARDPNRWPYNKSFIFLGYPLDFHLFEQVQQDRDHRVERGEVLVRCNEKQDENQGKIGDTDDHVEIVPILHGAGTGYPVEINQKECDHGLEDDDFDALGKIHL